MSEIESDAWCSHDTQIKYKDCNSFCSINVSFKLLVFHFTEMKDCLDWNTMPMSGSYNVS